MSIYDEIDKILRERHNSTMSWGSSGWTWSCSCGGFSNPVCSRPTEKQAAATRDKHLRAARRKIRDELES